MDHVESQLDKKKPQEILELKVKELSTVDRPAILEEFLVLKRQQEENMGAFTADPDNVEIKDEVVEKMKWVEVDVEKALPIDLRNALKAVIPWLKKNAGMDGAPKDEIMRVAAFLGKVEGGKYPEPAAKAKEEEMDDEKKKKAEKQDVCPKCGAEMKDGACTKCDYKVAADNGKETTKSASPLGIVIHPDGKVEVTGQDVAKGKAQFTTERTDAFKSSVGQLFTMLASVDKDAAKGIIEELTKTVLPADVKWTQGVTATPAAVKKSVEEGLASALEPITKALSDLGAKVETIEKSRPAPQSDVGDGDKQEIKKSDNVWDGLPL